MNDKTLLFIALATLAVAGIAVAVTGWIHVGRLRSEPAPAPVEDESTDASGVDELPVEEPIEEPIDEPVDAPADATEASESTEEA